jgi:hypothetical protein
LKLSNALIWATTGVPISPWVLDAPDDGVEAPVIGDAQFDSAGAAGFDHPVAFRYVERHGLFTKDVLARPGGENRLWSV